MQLNSDEFEWFVSLRFPKLVRSAVLGIDDAGTWWRIGHFSLIGVRRPGDIFPLDAGCSSLRKCEQIVPKLDLE